MALSFSEKRTTQKAIAENLATLAGGGLGFSDKRKSQSIITDGLKRLGETVVKAVDNLFQQIAKGIHDSLGAMGLFTKLKEEVVSLGEDVIAFDNMLNDSLKEACVKVAELAETEGLFA